MFYAYILFSRKTNKFYTGSTSDLKNRVEKHNKGLNQSTKGGMPWEVIFYASFISEGKAVQFEQYLKTGSGKAFLYKRLVPEDLKKDRSSGMACGSEA